MNDKLCVILNIAPHYRKAIYKAIDEAFDCDWYVGDRVDDIKPLGPEEFKNCTVVKNRNIYICIIYRCLKQQISNNSTHSILLIGLIGFFIVSLFSEGYIFAAGSPLCFTLWLLIGNCLD